MIETRVEPFNGLVKTTLVDSRRLIFQRITDEQEVADLVNRLLRDVFDWSVFCYRII